MKLHGWEPFKRILTRKRIVFLAIAKAIVFLVGLAAWRVHEVSALLAAEILFGLVFVALLGIAGSLYVVGVAAESIGRALDRTLLSSVPTQRLRQRFHSAGADRFHQT